MVLDSGGYKVGKAMNSDGNSVVMYIVQTHYCVHNYYIHRVIGVVFQTAFPWRAIGLLNKLWNFRRYWL